MCIGIHLGQNDSLTKELLCGILHPSITIKGIMLPNSPCQLPWPTWNFLMSIQWQLVGFYVSMTENVQIHQHQHGTYLALIPLMNFNMGALTWNPVSFCTTLVFGRVNALGLWKFHPLEWSATQLITDVATSCWFYFPSTCFWVVLYKYIQFLWIHLQGPELLTADSMLPVMAADDAWHHGMCVACSAKTDLWQGEWRCIKRWIKDDQEICRLQSRGTIIAS